MRVNEYINLLCKKNTMIYIYDYNDYNKKHYIGRADEMFKKELLNKPVKSDTRIVGRNEVYIWI